MNLVLSFALILTSNALFSQKTRDDSAAILSLGNVGLEKLNDVEEKKKFLDTVYMEKERIQGYVLKRILDNAYDLYNKGDYDGAAEIAKKVLSIDPNSEEARVIANASGSGGKVGKISYEEQMQNALSLYQKGEVLDAYKQMAVLSKLSPGNEKAKYWYKKMEADLKDYYLTQAQESYNTDKKTALSMYYKALEYAPKDENILSNITKIETDLRQDKVNQKLKEALDKYASGKLEESYNILKEAIDINPADEKTNKLFSELRAEIEGKYIKEGDSFYKRGQYVMSIKSFSKAMLYSENPQKMEKIISNIKKKMKKEEELKKKKEEEKRRREEERKKKKEEEEKKPKEENKSDNQNKEDNSKNIITEQNKKAAQEHWVNGVKYLQSGDYQKAKEELSIAKKLDPTNADVDAALKRIDQILSGGQ